MDRWAECTGKRGGAQDRPANPECGAARAARGAELLDQPRAQLRSAGLRRDDRRAAERVADRVQQVARHVLLHHRHPTARDGLHAVPRAHVH